MTKFQSAAIVFAILFTGSDLFGFQLGMLVAAMALVILSFVEEPTDD